ncbi:MAG: hypothetical protein AB7Q00_00655 [Phycisphaerales bacterium]
MTSTHPEHEDTTEQSPPSTARPSGTGTSSDDSSSSGFGLVFTSVLGTGLVLFTLPILVGLVVGGGRSEAVAFLAVCHGLGFGVCMAAARRARGGARAACLILMGLAGFGVTCAVMVAIGVARS